MEEETRYEACYSMSESEDNSSGDDIINIEVEFQYFIECSSPISMCTIRKSYPQSRHSLLSDTRRQSIINDALVSTISSAIDFIDYEFDIEAQEFIDSISPQVSSFASNYILDDPSNRRFTLHVKLVKIDPCTVYTPDWEEAEDDLGFEPTSKACIDGLESVRVRVEDVEEALSMEDCTICLEKPSVDDEVIWLPCNHVFHGDCILEWLQTSRLCPLCRFSMSIDGD